MFIATFAVSFQVAWYNLCIWN